jgi:arylamine N-acetyltransferase
MTEEDRAAAIRLIDSFRLARVRPDADCLHEIYAGFRRLPYENLTKLLRKHSGDPPSSWPRLPGEVVRDHLRFKAGGTCFSLTKLLEAILLEAGFRCYPVLADMPHGREIHCGLLVELAGRRFLLDPSYLLPAPMELRPDGGTTLRSPANQLTLVRSADHEFSLYSQKTGQPPKWRYTFSVAAVPDQHFMTRWIDSFSQTMMNSLVMTTLSADRQLYLHNDRLQEVTVASRRTTALRHDHASALEHVFGIDHTVAKRARDLWLDVRKTRRAPGKRGG